MDSDHSIQNWSWSQDHFFKVCLALELTKFLLDLDSMPVHSGMGYDLSSV